MRSEAFTKFAKRAGCSLVPGAVLIVLSAPYWWRRALYDDELYTLTQARLPSLSDVWRVMTHEDVHPPLQYLYAWLAYHSPLPHDLALKGSSLLSIAAALGILLHILLALGWSLPRATLAATLAGLHPNVFLWASALRWHPLWSALNLLLCAAALAWYRRPNWRTSAGVCLSGALAFLTNYASSLTLLALVCVAVLHVSRAPDHLRLRLKWALVVVCTWGALLLAYWPALSTHISNMGAQVEHTSRLKALGYNTFAQLLGQSVLPWDWLWLSAAAAGLAATATFAWRDRKGPERGLLLALGVLLAVVWLFSAGLATLKGRNFLVYSMLFSLAVPAVLTTRWRALWLCPLLVFWGVADVNVLRKQSLHKAGLEDPVPEIADAVVQFARTDALVAITHNVLGYYIADRIPPARTCSSYDMAALGGAPQGCPQELGQFRRVVFVESYLGSLKAAAEPRAALLTSLQSWGQLRVLGEYSLDEDWQQKNRWMPTANLVQWRFRVLEFAAPEPITTSPAVLQALAALFERPQAR